MQIVTQSPHLFCPNPLRPPEDMTAKGDDKMEAGHGERAVRVVLSCGDKNGAQVERTRRGAKVLAPRTRRLTIGRVSLRHQAEVFLESPMCLFQRAVLAIAGLCSLWMCGTSEFPEVDEERIASSMRTDDGEAGGAGGGAVM